MQEIKEKFRKFLGLENLEDLIGKKVLIDYCHPWFDGEMNESEILFIAQAYVINISCLELPLPMEYDLFGGDKNEKVTLILHDLGDKMEWLITLRVDGKIIYHSEDDVCTWIKDGIEDQPYPEGWKEGDEEPWRRRLNVKIL